MTKLNYKKKLTFLSVFAGAVLGTMHVVNKLFNYIATADNLLDDDACQYYEWRFGKIAYTKKGSGEPLLLVHDLNVCLSSHEWDKITNELARKNTVYRIDLLGCGCSDRPALTYTNFLYVQLITDFIKHIIGKKTDVVVSGESGSFVLMACANDDSIINRVVLINPQNIVDLAKIPTKRSNMIKYLLFSPVIGTFIYNMKVNKKTIRDKFVNSYYYNQNKVRENEILTCFESAQKKSTHSRYLYACLKSRYTNANVIYCLSKLSNSIFIITGSADPENALIAGQYQNHLPSIEIIGIKDTRQKPHLEKPEEFTDQIRILLCEEE